MAATLAAAIVGPGRDLVCSTVLSPPREGRFNPFRTITFTGNGAFIARGASTPP